MKEMEEESSCLSQGVEQRVGYLEARLPAAEQFIVSDGAPYPVCAKEERPTGEDDEARSMDSQHSLGAEGVWPACSGAAILGCCGAPASSATPPLSTSYPSVFRTASPRNMIEVYPGMLTMLSSSFWQRLMPGT